MIAQPLCLLHSSCSDADEALRLMQSRLESGFPSPAGDYTESLLSFNELLVKHPSATFVARASGNAMCERGILDGSLLIIDRAITAQHDSTVVVSLAGELSIKILDLHKRVLHSANTSVKPVPLPEDIDVVCEGVVTFCITPQANCAFPC